MLSVLEFYHRRCFRILPPPSHPWRTLRLVPHLPPPSHPWRTVRLVPHFHRLGVVGRRRPLKKGVVGFSFAEQARRLGAARAANTVEQKKLDRRGA